MQKSQQLPNKPASYDNQKRRPANFLPDVNSFATDRATHDSFGVPGTRAQLNGNLLAGKLVGIDFLIYPGHYVECSD